MVSITLTLDEKALRAGENLARAQGKTLDQVVQELLEHRASAPLSKAWVDEFVGRGKAAGGDSRGWRWNRGELYDG